MLEALRAYWRTSVAVMLAYRAAIALWALWGVVYPTVALLMWTAAQRGAGRADLGGYDQSAFAAYFLLMMITGHVTAAWDVYEMGFLVRSGAMSPRLLRPILPIWASLMENLAYKVVSLVLLVPIWVLLSWWFRPRFETTAAHLALGLLALLMAAGLNFLLGYTVGLVAFWTTRTDGLAELYFGVSLFLGGRFAPLSILPPLLRQLADALPFKWVIWFPTEILSGRLAVPVVARGLLWQGLWLAAVSLAFRWFWAVSLRRYAAVGG
jgi:ABC-2 type transport system permease protein